MMDLPILLPHGALVPAAPGKYTVIPAPDLNHVLETRFRLEYDFPHLLVTDMATRSGSGAEQREAIRQVETWRVEHPSIRGYKIGGSREGYLLFKPLSSHRTSTNRYQFIPAISFVDARTWSRVSDDDKNKAYVPCVPTIVIEIASETDSIPQLQAKLAKYVRAGTREAVIVDTRRDRVWIHNRHEQPYFDTLAPIEFDAWPNFTLDCPAIRDARTRAGLH